MPIRPIDVRRKEFKNGFRGYDANQVDDFLDAVADEFERSYNENQRMKEEVTSLRDRLQQFEDLEGSIRAALVHAEQAADDLRRSASRESEDTRQSAAREADLTVREAKNRSHQMLADSSARVERVQESYEALKDAKREFANDFRQLLRTHMDVMESMEVSSARDIESSLRARLDTESIVVAREAAVQEEATLREEEAALQEEEAALGEEATGPIGEPDADDPAATQILDPAYVEEPPAPEPAAPTAEPSDVEQAETGAVDDVQDRRRRRRHLR